MPQRVVCFSFLATVVRPIYLVTKSRMKRDRLTYDDLNEFFWLPTCLDWQPFAHEPRCITLALRRCHKSHMERHSWLHLLHCFQRPFSLILTVTLTLLVVANCYNTPGLPASLFCARLSFCALYLFSVQNAAIGHCAAARSEAQPAAYKLRARPCSYTRTAWPSRSVHCSVPASPRVDARRDRCRVPAVLPVHVRGARPLPAPPRA